MSITPDHSENLRDSLHVAPGAVAQRLKQELAVALYAQNALGLGKAAELAGQSRLELNDILAERAVPMHYGQEELAEDLAYASGCP